MKNNKIILILGLLSGALLTAGLFFFNSEKNKTDQQIKPSQINFLQSNSLQETSTRKPTENSLAKPQPEPLRNQHLADLVQKLSMADREKWDVLNTILNSKNDNDSRLDLQLRSMNPALHEVLYEKYELLALEDRNGRGLIAFLIARDMKSQEDFQFLQKIYQETPCLGLADCRAPINDGGEGPGSTQTTLVYPQMAVLFQIEKKLAEHPEILNKAESRSGISQILIQAESFPIPMVIDRARAIRTRYQL